MEREGRVVNNDILIESEAEGTTMAKEKKRTRKRRKSIENQSISESHETKQTTQQVNPQ